MISLEERDEIEDLIGWNLSFGITMEETLEEINMLEYLDLFTD